MRFSYILIAKPVVERFVYFSVLLYINKWMVFASTTKLPYSMHFSDEQRLLISLWLPKFFQMIGLVYIKKYDDTLYHGFRRAKVPQRLNGLEEILF